jgi:methylmalonyl-CoA mutase C-terminal domain/subunit
MSARPKRILVAKPGLDGHDVGAKVVVRAFVDAGFEVIYTGLHQTPEAIANAALEEDVDVVGLSLLSGSHMPLCARVRDLLVESGLGERLMIVGGNIPETDRDQLIELGIDGVFPTSSKLEDIVSFVRENTS